MTCLPSMDCCPSELGRSWPEGALEAAIGVQNRDANLPQPRQSPDDALPVKADANRRRNGIWIIKQLAKFALSQPQPRPSSIGRRPEPDRVGVLAITLRHRGARDASATATATARLYICRRARDTASTLFCSLRSQ